MCTVTLLALLASTDNTLNLITQENCKSDDTEVTSYCGLK